MYFPPLHGRKSDRCRRASNDPLGVSSDHGHASSADLRARRAASLTASRGTRSRASLAASAALRLLRRRARRCRRGRCNAGTTGRAGSRCIPHNGDHLSTYIRAVVRVREG